MELGIDLSGLIPALDEDGSKRRPVGLATGPSRLGPDAEVARATVLAPPTPATAAALIEARAGEHCATCSGDLAERGSFCRFYLRPGERLAFCTPACAEAFLRGPDDTTAQGARRGCLDRLLEELRWRHGCRTPRNDIW